MKHTPPKKSSGKTANKTQPIGIANGPKGGLKPAHIADQKAEALKRNQQARQKK